MASSVKVKQAGAQHFRGLRMSDLPNNSDLRRLDWLVAPVYSPGWFIADTNFGDDVAVTGRPAGYVYVIPGYTGKFTGALTLSGAGVDGQVLELRINDVNWQFELEGAGGVIAGRVPVAIGGGAGATRDNFVAAINALFGTGTARALGAASVRLYGPRIVGATAGSVFGSFDYGRDHDAFVTPGIGHLRNVRPPSGFPSISYTIEDADGPGTCILEVTGLDSRLLKRKEWVRIDYGAGRTKVWGSVGFRHIENIKVVQGATAGGETLYVGYDLNARKTLEIPFLTDYNPGGAGDILTITVGGMVRSYGLIAGGDVTYAAAATAQLTAINLANAIANDVIAGNLPSDVHVTTDYGVNNALVSADALVWVSCEDRDLTLTLAALPNNGPTFGPVSGTVYFDDPGEDDDWALGFPFEFLYDDRFEDRPSNEIVQERQKFHNIDGFHWMDLNAWAWNPATTVWLLKGRGHGFITGTNDAGGAPVTPSKLMGGGFGKAFTTVPGYPIFERGVRSFDASDEDKKDLNTWKPPIDSRPICSAGTGGSTPINQAQYRLYVFRLNERSKIPPWQHGEGK